jgi:hypothetical protein
MPVSRNVTRRFRRIPPGRQSRGHGEPVVAVAHGGARPGVAEGRQKFLGGDQPHHQAVGQVQAVGLEEIQAVPVNVQHEAVVGQGLLGRPAVGQNLVLDLLFQQRDPPLDPLPALGHFAEHRPGEDKPHGFANRVIPPGGVKGKIPGNPPAVLVDGLKQGLPVGFG